MTTPISGDIDRLRDFYRHLHHFGVRLADAAGRFQQLVRAGKWPEREVPLVYDRNDPRDPLNRSIDITREFEFLVAVTGAFSSGKSTLLNVLLDFPDLLPVSAIPLTAVCTAIRHGELPRIQVRYVPFEECFERIRMFTPRPFRREFRGPEQLEEAIDRPESFLDDPADRQSLRRFARLLSRYDEITGRSVTFDERAPYIAGGGVVPVSGDGGSGLRYFLPTPGQEEEYVAAGGDPDLWVTREWLTLIRDVTLWVDSPLLHNDIVFLDLPGLNCREDYHRRAIQEYCTMADCIVVTAFQPGNQADEEVVGSFKRLSSNYRQKLFFVLNRVDQFTTEPQELVRSFDYLTRDCIGMDFPKNRCFLTSAYFGRESRTGRADFPEEFDRFVRAFDGLESSVPALDDLIGHAAAREDPGGVGYFRRSLASFLTDDAYRTKIEEILRNYGSVLDRVRSAASPHYEDYLRLDERDLLLRSAFDYFRRIEQMAKGALYTFRFEYLRGSGNVDSSLAQDLKPALERAHAEIERAVAGYFNEPVATSPPREDPVGEFDLRRIADDASGQLRRRFQEIVASAVVDCARHRIFDYLNRSRLREHIRNLFGSHSEASRRLEGILERFELMLRHSVLCRIRNRFYSMPGGRDLKRLDRSIELAEMKKLLIEVFSDFYPNWIFQNIYGEIQDGLWLSFFLDAEELEVELDKYFETCQGSLASTEVLEKVKIPENLGGGVSDLYEAAGVCKEIDALVREKETLEARDTSHTLAHQV